MATDVRKLALGAVALLLSSVLIVGTGVPGAPVPSVLAAVAAVGLATGSLLVGLSEDNATV
jgi:hypothetical protein